MLIEKIHGLLKMIHARLSGVTARRKVLEFETAFPRGIAVKILNESAMLFGCDVRDWN